MATHYIAPDGNDAAAGAIDSPLLTIAHCLSSHASNGDTIILRAGTWHERGAGLSTSLTNLTIKGYTGETAILSGSDLYTSWTKTDGYTNVYQAAYTPSSCWAVWNGGTALTSAANLAGCDTGTNKYYFDNAGDKLYVNIGGSAPTSIEVTTANAYGLTIGGAGCTIQDLSFQWWFQAGLNITAGTATVTGCTFRYHMTWGNVDFSQLRLGGDTYTITNCAFSGNNGGSSGMISIAVRSTAANATISNCTFTGSAYGVDVRGGTGHVVHTCTFDSHYDGISSYNATATVGLTVYSCTIRDNTHGILCFGGTTNATIRHITGYQIGTTNQYGIILHNNGTVGVYHCVLAWLNKGSSYGNGLHLAPLSGTLTITAYNNAFFQCERGINEVSGSCTITTDYNGFYGNTENFRNLSEGEQGTHNVTSDPLFVDGTNYDYRLTAGSPYVNAGVAVEGINDGYIGAAPDIGRFEYAPSLVMPRSKFKHLIVR